MRKRPIPNPLVDLIMTNNLEARVSLATYRLFFVEDTEDYMYRKGKLGKKQNPQLQQLQQTTKRKKLEKLLEKGGAKGEWPFRK